GFNIVAADGDVGVCAAYRGRSGNAWVQVTHHAAGGSKVFPGSDLNVPAAVAAAVVSTGEHLISMTDLGIRAGTAATGQGNAVPRIHKDVARSVPIRPRAAIADLGVAAHSGPTHQANVVPRHDDDVAVGIGIRLGPTVTDLS